MTSRKLLIDNVSALKHLINEEQGIPDELVGGAGGIPILTGYGSGLVAAGGANYGFQGSRVMGSTNKYKKVSGSNLYQLERPAIKSKSKGEFMADPNNPGYFIKVGGAKKQKALSRWQLFMKSVHDANPDVPIAALSEMYKGNYHQMKADGSLDHYLASHGLASGKKRGRKSSKKLPRKVGGYIYG